MAKRQKAPAPAASADENTLIEGVEASNETESTDAPQDTADISEDEILAELEAADTSVEDTTEQTEVEVQATEDVDVSLEEQDEDAILAEIEATEDTKPSKKRASKKAASPAAPLVTRQFCDVADHMDDAALKSALDSINAKKVQEKATNVVQAITSGKKLSGFTKLAVKTLLSNGRINAKTLVEAYQADGKSLGTARAQAQQMTALFKALGIAQPDPANPRELVPASNGLVRELELLAA